MTAPRDEYAKPRGGWLTVSEQPHGNVSVELRAEPSIGPFDTRRHVQPGGWRWYQYGKLWGPTCRTRVGCRFAHWQRTRHIKPTTDDREEQA